MTIFISSVVSIVCIYWYLYIFMFWLVVSMSYHLSKYLGWLVPPTTTNQCSFLVLCLLQISTAKFAGGDPSSLQPSGACSPAPWQAPTSPWCFNHIPNTYLAMTQHADQLRPESESELMHLVRWSGTLGKSDFKIWYPWCWSGTLMITASSPNCWVPRECSNQLFVSQLPIPTNGNSKNNG